MFEKLLFIMQALVSGTETSDLVSPQTKRKRSEETEREMFISPVKKAKIESKEEAKQEFTPSQEPITDIHAAPTSKRHNSPQLSKEEIIKILEDAFHIKLSYKILTDINFDESIAQFTYIGRPDTGASKAQQMRHVIPFSFVKQLISGMIEDAKHPGEILDKLLIPSLAFTKMQKGFALTSSQLESEEYADIRQHAADQHNRSLARAEEQTYLFSPPKAAMFHTPNRKAQAEKDFSIAHTQYVKEALETLLEQVEKDSNTNIIASEILTRLMFTIFNSSENTCFAEEGNTLIYEIRLYEDVDSATNQPNKADYDIITARELQVMIEKRQVTKDSLNGRIRIVDCEGSKVREINKALKAINKICASQEDNSDDIKTYNEKYNYQLKLSNCDITHNYNKAITNTDYSTSSSYHIAKLLYGSFDLKALEDIVFAPQVNSKTKPITVYTAAKGDVTSSYQIIDGDKARAVDIGRSTGYTSKSVFRDLNSRVKCDNLIFGNKIKDCRNVKIPSF
jgi:hypothetical protein